MGLLNHNLNQEKLSHHMTRLTSSREHLKIFRKRKRHKQGGYIALRYDSENSHIWRERTIRGPKITGRRRLLPCIRTQKGSLFSTAAATKQVKGDKKL